METVAFSRNQMYNDSVRIPHPHRTAGMRKHKETPYKEAVKMAKYVCDICGYEYDPEVGDPDNGIEPGTAFEDLPEDWACPVCGVGKDSFSEA